MGQNSMAVGQFYPKQGVRQNFDYCTFNGNGFFSWHVNISGSPSVIKTVCSK